MDSRIVIAAYKPKTGKEKELTKITMGHYDILFTEGLVTDRKPIIITSADGTVVEIFEWKNKEAIEKAHQNAIVGNLWKAFSEVCDFIPLSQIPEINDLFAEFSPVNS